MRIAMIGPFGLKYRGTIQVRALPLARELAAKGHEVLIVMPPWKDPTSGAGCWSDAGVTLEYVSIKPAVPILRELFITYRLIRAACAWQPDVVHIFKPKAYSGLAGCYFRHQLIHRPRLVVDEDDWEGAGGWNEVSNYSALLKRFFAWQENWGLRHCNAVTVASRALQTLVWALGVEAPAVHYVPNGAIPRERGDRLRGRELFALGDGPLVLLYTRLFEFDPARVVHMLARLVELRPDACLLVVGKALFTEADVQLDTRVIEAGLQDHVVRTGWVEESVLPDLLAAADVAWFPFDDTLINRTKCSVKLLDLLAAGVPTVADAVGQNKEYIQHGETGLLVEAGDEAAMLAATLQILDDRELADRLGAAAAQRMEERYNWSILAERTLEAYST